MSSIPVLRGDWDADDWRKDAACRDTAPDLFFPVGVTGPAIDQIESAKAVCGTCPVRAACLEFALMTNQESGVWGGTTEEERRRIRRMWLARRRHAQGREAKTAQGRAVISEVEGQVGSVAN